MHFEWRKLRADELREQARLNAIVIVPVASLEQHGPHLPLGVDTFIAEAYLARVRHRLPDELPVTFLPLQRIGVSVEHVAFPGTLTLSAATAIAAWTAMSRAERAAALGDGQALDRLLALPAAG